MDDLPSAPGNLAKHFHVPRTRVARLCEERTSAMPDTAKRLSKAFVRRQSSGSTSRPNMIC